MSGFTLVQIADHLRCSYRYAITLMEAAGVQRRVKYIAGEDLDGTGKPRFYKFTQQETERILQEAYRRRGAAEERKLRTGTQKAPKGLKRSPA